MATYLSDGAPVSGTSGTNAAQGVAYGDELIDIVNKVRYVNTSRISNSPTWSGVTGSGQLSDASYLHASSASETKTGPLAIVDNTAGNNALLGQENATSGTGKGVAGVANCATGFAVYGVNSNAAGYGIYNAGGFMGTVGPLVAVPSTTQVMVAATTLLANALKVRVSTASNITSTAAPTIADGTFDGQTIHILNVGSFNYIISDQGTLASSNLRLTATTVTIAPRQSVLLQWDATITDWVQITPLCAVL